MANLRRVTSPLFALKRNLCDAGPPPKVAVLYQAIDSPIINGVSKPRKPGGYRDSSADIAYVLKRAGVQVTTPMSSPNSSRDLDWCFPDTEHGILDALSKGADTLWANTILFASHPLQKSTKIPLQTSLVGQPPTLVEKFDDKALTNDLLRSKANLTLPLAWTVTLSNQSFWATTIHDLPYPIVAKPIRGRGSHGVKLCYDIDILRSHAAQLFTESPTIMIEEYLAGEEATITVIPPSAEQPHYRSLPVITRFNHQSGIAPYNGIVAVLSNSRLVSPAEYAADTTYAEICASCEKVAEILQATAPVRIDVRRKSDGARSAFVMFDVNMKPNMTGPGRTGREEQASLSVMAAAGAGMDYADFLKVMLSGRRTLGEIREMG